MATWSINGGGIGSINAQSGFGGFSKNPFAIPDNKPNTTGGFGSNSSPMAANTVNSFNASSSSMFATQPPPPIGGSTTNTWFRAPQPAPIDSSSSTNPTARNPFSLGVSNPQIRNSPFGTKNQIGGARPCSSSNSIAGKPFSFGVSTSLPAQTTSNSPSNISTSPFWTKNQTGGAPPPFSSVNSTSFFNQTNPVHAFPMTSVPPFHSSSSSSNSTAGAPFSFGVTTSLPVQTSISTPSSINTSPFGTKYQTGGAPFSSPPVNSTSLFNQTNPVPAFQPFHSPSSPKSTAVAPFSFGVSTSPFGITTPSTSSSSTGFSFAPQQSPMTSFGTTSAFNNYTKVQQDNTPASNVSVFAPFTSTNPWNSGIQGTRQKAYAKTREEGDASNGVWINSISAMPDYQNKSHEELRLEDYKLTGKTGTDSSYNIPIISIVNPSPFTSPSFPPSTPSTSIFNKPTPFLPPFQPVTMPIPPSVLPATQTTTTVPDSGSGFTVPATDSIITNIPKMVSQEGVSLRENNQQQQLVLPASPCPVSVGPSLVTNPFATEVRDKLPIRTVQYGISCLPVSENPQPAKKMPLVNVRQLSIGRRRPSIEKYKPNEDEKKVPFFEELPGIYKKGGVLFPRENPRSWVVLPNDEQRLEKNMSTLSVSDHSTNLCKTGGTQYENGSLARECAPKTNLSKEIKHEDDRCSENENTAAMIIGNGHDHKEPNTLAMIPQIKCPEYYMEPPMEDLAVNELSHVKDFVIGRLNCGSIKFLGETDVRSLDVESIVRFGNREVNVYEDENGKPPVGQGLNKAAEITLLNIKCIDKNTGKQHIDGPKVDQYKKYLVRKAVEQGAEFVSFDPVKGEWRFKVQHF